MIPLSVAREKFCPYVRTKCITNACMAWIVSTIGYVEQEQKTHADGWISPKVVVDGSGYCTLMGEAPPPKEAP